MPSSKVRRDYNADRTAASRQKQAVHKYGALPEGHEQLCEPRRCPGCGHKVEVWPCLGCKSRREVQRKIVAEQFVAIIEARRLSPC